MSTMRSVLNDGTVRPSSEEIDGDILEFPVWCLEDTVNIQIHYYSVTQP